MGISTLGIIGVFIRLTFFSGERIGNADTEIHALSARVERLENKTDHLHANIQELLLSVGMLQGEVKRINGKPH